ncbi:MAG: Dabb family protein [Sphingomicrobium sp.]
MTGEEEATSTAGQIVHHVLFWLRDEASASDREDLIAGLRGLAEIDVVRSVRVGVPAGTESRDVVDASFDVSELMIFDSVADQQVYQDHPLHRAFVAKCGHLWRKVVVYDVATL